VNLARVFISIALILLVIGIVRGGAWLIMRTRAKRGLGIVDFQMGRPAILYFTTPDCIPCRTIQRPALASIGDIYGERLQIITIDAYQNPALADRWGVLSVPTTFIIDRQGRPRGVNHGVARAERLQTQLTQIDQLLSSAQMGATLDTSNRFS
jgi:thiol-disulfide isomerase/thioredoxin